MAHGDRPASRSPDGLVVVDKPAGLTSHDVVARVRRLAGTRRVGHAGTLDPMATGVLVLGVDRATRLLGHLALTEKAYDATIRLGATTVTDDAEGEVVATADATGVTDEAIAAGVAALTGDIAQVPSAVSAIKVDGQRAYKRVRAGEDVELAARPVTVRTFDVHERPARRTGVVDLDVTVDVLAPAPTSARWPATSAPRSASAVTSPRCAAPGSGPTAWTPGAHPRAAGDERRTLLPDRRGGARRRSRSATVDADEAVVVSHGGPLPAPACHRRRSRCSGPTARSSRWSRTAARPREALAVFV